MHRLIELNSDISPSPATYVLILSARDHRRLQVGRLGWLDVRPGFYLYVGSAFGPGGLRARVAHHLNNTSRPHWHIDYLRAVTMPDDVWHSFGLDPAEHDWASAMATLPEGTIPLAGFGSSDCTCESHLFFFHSCPSLRDFRRQIQPKEQSCENSSSFTE